MTKTGRPTKFSQKLVDTICQRIADGESLRSICHDNDMPVTSTVCKWLAENERFSEQYAHARQAQADAIFDDCLDIADDSGVDVSVDENGKYTVDGEAIQRARLRIDTRKWMAGKLRPKKYGDRVLNEHTGPDGGPMKFERVERVIVDPKNTDS